MEGKDNLLAISEFSEYPGPRYCIQGEKSGEEFYFNKLNPTFAEILKSGEKLTIVLDGTAGYASSFLDEAFGNLVFDFSLEKVEKNINIVSNEEPDWVNMILKETLPEWEQRRIKNEEPKITVNHDAFYKYVNNGLERKDWRH